MRLLFVSLSILAFLACYSLGHSHSHEAPHLKYGREVNEAAARGEETIDHGHSHSHHGHSHDHEEEDDHLHHGHAHSHLHHGHSHDHEEEDVHAHHGHAHSHLHHGHSHDHEEEDVHAHHGHAHEHGEGCGHSHGGHGHSHSHSETKKPSASATSKEFKLYDKNGYFARLNDPQTRLWTYSLGATFLISAIPCIMLAFIPISSDSDNSSKLKLMLALGAGGLLGDVFLHLLPHAQEARESLSGGHGHSHSHGHSHGDGEEPHVHDSFIGLWVLGGLLFFFVAEKLIRILSGSDSGHGHSHDAPQKSHGHSHAKDKKKKAKQSDNEEESGAETDHDTRPLLPSREDEEAKHLRIVSWLNLISDFLHNTTDGMAIGASFIAGPVPGFWTTFMVFVHEIPHELGDFALLVRSGYSKPCAMLIQLATAIGAFIGCCIALNSVDGHKWEQEVQSSWVMPFTAGGFIYIATVSVLPELLNKSSFLLTIGEVLAMGVGVFAMYLIGFLEHMSIDEVLSIVRRYGLNV